MPELPEVDAVARRLGEWATGRTLVEAHFLRPQTTRPLAASKVARQLKGRMIRGTGRRAKNVLVQLEGGLTLRVHLGMTGNLYVGGPELRSAATRAWFPLDDGRAMIFDDSRLFGRIQVLTAVELDEFSQQYGVEPLSDAFTAGWLAERMGRSRKPAKVFLLDQAHVVGLGNIWAAEALFAARVHPFTAVNTLKARQVTALHRAIREILSHAVAEAYRHYSTPGTTAESEGFGVAVYNREGQPCPRCRRAVERVAQAGRSSYFCPRCQKA